MPQVFKLGYDASAYTTDDIATLFLIRPHTEIDEKPTIVLRSSLESIQVELTKVDLPEDESPGATIFSGIVRLKKPVVQPAASETSETSSSANVGSAVGIASGAFIPVGLIPRPRPPIIFVPPIALPGEEQPQILEIKVGSDDAIIAEYAPTQDQIYKSTAFVREYLRPKIEKKRIGDDYYRIWLKDCACCDDLDERKVLLTVLTLDPDAEPKKAKMLVDPTAWYRSIVYNNPMLYDLISCHLVDTGNPHNFRALQRIMYEDNTIGNKDGSPIDVPEVKFIAGTGINIIPEDVVDSSSKIYKSIKLEAKDIGGGIVATSGILKFPGVGLGQYWLSKQVLHGAAGEDGTPPSITLGLWNKDDNTVYYMEDMYSLRTIGALHPVTDPQNPSDEPSAELKKILQGQDHSVFFKAVDIDKERFRILVVKVQNQEAPTEGVIRW